MNTVELLERRLAREQAARRQAERILEEKSLLLYESDKQLRQLNDNLEQQVKSKVEQLQQSEQRYRQLIESVQDIIYKISPTGYFTFVNSVVERYLGYTGSELIGQHFISLVRPDYRAQLTTVYQAMVQTGMPDTYQEFPVIAKDGRTVWIGQTVQLVENAGEVAELVAVARDITKRKSAEDAFQLTQTRLTSLITNLNSAVLLEDEAGTVILANQLYCDLFGLHQQAESLAGKAYGLVARPPAALFSDAELFWHQREEAARNQRALIDELIQLADGRVLSWNYIPIWLAGEYRGHLWQYTDITEQHETNERIRRSEEKYRGIMNRMELGLLEVDATNVIQRAYDRFCNMVGYTQAELIGKFAPDLLLTEASRALVTQHPEDQPEAARSYELELIRKDGQHIWVLVSGVPIVDQRGQMTGTMVIHYEITERKRLEQELAQAKQIAEDARFTETQFLANMSHEIRTPLNAILGFSSLLESSGLDGEKQEWAHFIRTAGKNLLVIVNDILDISKIEAGMVSLESIPFSISSLVESIRTMLDSAAGDKNLWLVAELDPLLPTVVLGDPTRLTQILLNLLSNAIKFSQQGGVRVRVDKADQTAETVRVRFQIEDTGIGMSADVLPHIFDRFRQASNFTTRYYGGTGLGLSIVKSLTELQGGWVRVSSTPGEGSCFTLEIPYQISSLPVEQVVDGSAGLAVPEGAGRMILVVEDNPMNQKLALQVLKRLGYPAQVADNGQQALDLLQAGRFDLVLMDIQMPIMDGYVTTRHIRNTLGSQVPIIAMTAHALVSEREQCLQAGMNDFLPKPFQIEELQRILRTYLSTPPAQKPPVGLVEVPLPIPVEETGFSVPTLLQAVDEDRELAAELVSLFLEQTPAQLQAMHQALAQDDLVTVGRYTHTQKASLTVFGLVQAARLSQTIESLIAERQSFRMIAPVVKQYIAILDEALPAMRTALATDLGF